MTHESKTLENTRERFSFHNIIICAFAEGVVFTISGFENYETECVCANSIRTTIAVQNRARSKPKRFIQ